MADERLLVGFDSDDDACVYLASDDIAIVQTIDFFPPVVDDPYDFGRIAAANALSDIYAMGAEPKTALNLFCFPSCLDAAIARRILEGGADTCFEAGTSIAGGHSIEDDEPKYGLSVMGICHPDRIRRNDTPRIGDHIVLTKKLGTGALTTGAKAGLLPQEAVDEMIQTMAEINRYAFEASKDLDVSAATDVTGFGLLGHAREMAGKAQRVTLALNARSVPLLPQAEEMARDGILPAGAYRNRSFVGDRVVTGPDVPLAVADLMFDPQTSGGLLLAMAEDDVERYIQRRIEQGARAWDIGRVLPWEGVEIKVD